MLSFKMVLVCVYRDILLMVLNVLNALNHANSVSMRPTVHSASRDINNIRAFAAQ
jgi:hypothetical protein